MWKQGMELMKKTLYDPHTWLDPEKAGEEAQIIADKLSEVDSVT